MSGFVVLLETEKEVSDADDVGLHKGLVEESVQHAGAEHVASCERLPVQV